MDLVVTKWIAMEAAVILERERGQELRRHFPEALTDNLRSLHKELNIEADIRAVNHFGTADLLPLAKGGIFTALWQFAERNQAGLEVDLRKIPVKQEIIEVCEYFALNPYKIRSGGSLLIGTENGAVLVHELAKQHISSALIGHTTAGNDRLLYNRGHIRYLDRPARDELDTFIR